MKIDRQAFNYRGKVLIEKVIMQIPFHYEAVFQNEGCLLYFKDVDTRLFSSQDDLHIKSNDALLLRCGVYFFDLLKKTNKDKVEVIAIHLYPEMLKEIFLKELPASIEQRNYQKKSQIITPKNIISKFIESLEFYFDNPFLVNDELLELKTKELILLLVQTKSVASILELTTDLYSTKTVQMNYPAAS